MNNKKHNNSFIVEVLDFLLSVPESYYLSFSKKDFYNIFNGLPADKKLTCSNIARIFNQLRKTGYIKVETNKEGNTSVRFTNKSRLVLVDKYALRLTSSDVYYFISFDIPESLRLNRDRFRRIIKKLGFIQIQKSLWVNNKDAGDFIEAAATEYKVNDFIVYISSNNTNINDYINQKLSISKRSTIC